MKKIILTYLLAANYVFAAPFGDQGNGTVTDYNTGLTWQKCSYGQSGADCSRGQALLPGWQRAQDYCSTLSLAGRSWRLPSRSELAGIVDYSRASGATIDLNAFPGTYPQAFWSGTTFGFVSDRAWQISFTYGYSDRHDKTSGGYVRCVSGEESRPVFQDNNDGTVSEMTSGLVWQQCSWGQSGSGCKKGKPAVHSWSEAVEYCDGLDLAGRSWRLPEIYELETLLALDKSSSPTIDEKYFPRTDGEIRTGASGYWSNTTYAPLKTRARILVFAFGDSSHGDKSQKSSYVRCVGR